MRKKLIIFGGSFDPIHKGHITIAKKAFQKIKANKLFFVPCSSNYPGNKQISATNEERIDMIKLAIKDIDHFEICDYEIQNGDKPSYTINTIRYIKEYYSEYDLYLLIGYDQLVNFKFWKDYQEILEYVKIICHVRKINFDLLKEIDFPFIKLGIFNINTSSTELKLEPSRKFLPEEIIKYINENGVYGKERLQANMSPYRFEHSMSVANIAKEIALNFKLYPLVKKAYVAGLYHDYAKEVEKNKQIEIATKKLNIKDYPSWKVLHSYVGAYLIEKRFFIDDYQVLTAIKNHTIPKDFSTLTKIVYIADKIAPREDNKNNRDYLRWVDLAKQNLDQCFRTIIEYYQNLSCKE